MNASPTLRLEVLRQDELTSAQRQTIIDLCTAAYDEDFSDFFNAFPSSTHVLAQVDGRWVSHAAWVTRWLQPASCSTPLRTAYVEAVGTLPAYRQRGYAFAVLRCLATQLQEYELGGLSPSDPAFYARLGWELWRGPLAIRTEQGLLATPNEDELMILRLPHTPALDLDSLMTAEWRTGELW